MAQPIKRFEFTYEDIFNLCGFRSFDSGKNRIYKEKSSGFDPSNLKSLLLFLVRHADARLREEILDSMYENETSHKTQSKKPKPMTGTATKPARPSSRKQATRRESE